MGHGPNVKYKAIKWEESTGEKLNDLRCGDDFLDAAPGTESMKERINMLAFIRIKNCSVKDNIKKIRR